MPIEALEKSKPLEQYKLGYNAGLDKAIHELEDIRPTLNDPMTEALLTLLIKICNAHKCN